MKKLNLDNVAEFKEYVNPKAGGYICGIAKAEDVPEKEYLKVYYDIMEGEFKSHYTKLIKEGVMKEYPFFFASYKDSALGFFKGTITSVEKSNKGYAWDNDEKKLKGKKVGLVLFEQEYISKDGKVKTSLKVSKAHSIDAIKSGDFDVPERECVAQSTSSSSFTATTFGSTPSQPDPFADKVEDTFEAIPENVEEDCPFFD